MDNVKLNKIEFVACNDIKDEEDKFLNGKLDITDSVTSDMISTFKQAKTLQLSKALGTSYFYIDCSKKPFDNVNVRKALALSISRAEIGKMRNRGDGFEAYSLIPPGTLNFTSQQYFTDDVELAKELLAQAGYPNGEKFPTIK